MDIGIGALAGILIGWHVGGLRKKEKFVKNKTQDRCPECGASRACYSCVTQGGWRSQAEEDEYEREQALERTPD